MAGKMPSTYRDNGQEYGFYHTFHILFLLCSDSEIDFQILFIGIRDLSSGHVTESMT